MTAATRRSRLAALLLSALFAGAADNLRAAEPALADLNRDPLLMRAIFERVVSHPDHHIRFAPSGAASSNVDFERQPIGPWFIESQRYGADLVEAGLLAGDPKLVEQGWKVFDWGFARQASDGSFGDTGDPFHSASFFVEAVSRALVMTQQLDAPAADELTKKYSPKIGAATRWMLQPKVKNRGLANNRPYTHRRWLVAAAWALANEVAPGDDLIPAAAEQAREGLVLQRVDGVNPEKEGFDVSYQAAGLMFAARYYTVCRDAELRASIRQMLDRGLTCELRKIDADGRIDVSDSTRITSEVGRTGAAKSVDNKAVVQALVYGSRLLDRPDCYAAAERVARHLRWIKS